MNHARAVRAVGKPDAVGPHRIRRAEQHYERAHAVRADIHERAVRKRGVEGVFHHAVFKFVVARGILAVLKVRKAKRPEPRQRFAHKPETVRVHVSHGLHQHGAVLPRRALQFFELAQIRNDGFFTQHVFAVRKQQLRLLKMQRVGARDIHGVHTRALGEPQKVVERQRHAVLPCVRPRFFEAAGIHGLALNIRAVPRRREEPVRYKIGADGGNADHTRRSPFAFTLYIILRHFCRSACSCFARLFSVSYFTVIFCGIQPLPSRFAAYSERTHTG